MARSIGRRSAARLRDVGIGILVTTATAQAQTPTRDADASAPRNEERVLAGTVVDEITRAPIPGAIVTISGLPGVATDSLGHFRVQGIHDGPQELRVRQFGYVAVTATVVPPALPDVLVEIPLAPAPFALDGITTVVDHLATMNRRIRSRRLATGVSVRAIDQERMMKFGAATISDYLDREPLLNSVPCPDKSLATRCFLRRGRVIEPRVVIDERIAFGGIEELETYSPSDLYLMEIYSSGTQIRAYTYWFMERLAQRPQALLPVDFIR